MAGPRWQTEGEEGLAIARGECKWAARARNAGHMVYAIEFDAPDVLCAAPIQITRLWQMRVPFLTTMRPIPPPGPWSEAPRASSAARGPPVRCSHPVDYLRHGEHHSSTSGRGATSPLSRPDGGQANDCAICGWRAPRARDHAFFIQIDTGTSYRRIIPTPSSVLPGRGGPRPKAT